MRERALTAVALKPRGLPPEAVVAEIAAEARRKGLPGGAIRPGHSVAAVFPNRTRIGRGGRVWEFVPKGPQEADAIGGWPALLRRRVAQPPVMPA